MHYAVNLSACSKKMSQRDLIPYVKNAGFDSCFCDGGVAELAPLIRREGLLLQSVHAPFGNVHHMWEEGDAGKNALNELVSCLEECARAEAPLMVCHVFIGFGEEHPNALGVERFGALVRRAEALGVKIAFENTEGESYLAAIKDALWTSDYAGFCIDTGHEMCYNRSQDLISRYGADCKVFATHLNDNLGITGDQIFWTDDAHLLPFDGIADWQGIARRLSAAGCPDTLTMELTLTNKPERHTHDRYDPLSVPEFLELAFERLKRFESML